MTNRNELSTQVRKWTLKHKHISRTHVCRSPGRNWLTFALACTEADVDTSPKSDGPARRTRLLITWSSHSCSATNMSSLCLAFGIMAPQDRPRSRLWDSNSAVFHCTVEKQGGGSTYSFGQTGRPLIRHNPKVWLKHNCSVLSICHLGSCVGWFEGCFGRCSAVFWRYLGICFRGFQRDTHTDKT